MVANHYVNKFLHKNITFFETGIDKLPVYYYIYYVNEKTRGITMAKLFDTKYITKLQQNNNVAPRVKIVHHVRNIEFDKFLSETVMGAIKETDDEYSFRCQNILIKNTNSFLNYMWNPSVTNMFVQKKIKGLNVSNFDTDTYPNFYLSRNAGEATIIFTSLTNNQQTEFVKRANLWGTNLNIKFFAINGLETTNASAEILANNLIKVHSDSHCVFVTSNMAARSFSVPKIVNGIMMVNEPGYASAIQKYNRLSTIDWDNLNKVSHMYWFNFKSLKLVCPLFNIIYNDLNEKKKQQVIYGKSIKTMFATIDIFRQDNETQAETTKKWTEQDIFNEINKGIVKHDFIANHLRNCVPEIEEIVAEIRNSINFDDFGMKTVKLGKTAQKTIGGGKSGNIIRPDKPEDNEETEKKVKIKFSDLEIATTMVTLTLNHDETDRDFRTFCADCKYLFTFEGIRKIGEKNMKKLWAVFENNIKNLKWNVK